jgi:hypothetical protein
MKKPLPVRFFSSPAIFAFTLKTEDQRTGGQKPNGSESPGIVLPDKPPALERPLREGPQGT